MSATPKARIDVSCPCGASLTVEASGELCVERVNDFTKAHQGHRAPTPPVVYRDRWYPHTPYWSPPHWGNTSGSLDINGARIANGSVVMDATGDLSHHAASMRAVAQDAIDANASWASN